MSRSVPYLLCGLLAATLVWLARTWTPVRMLEAVAYDASVRAHARPLPDPPLIITLDGLTQEPNWPDRLAELLTQLHQFEPKALLLDMLLKPGPNYGALAEAILAFDPILICYPDEKGGWVDPDPQLAVAVTRLGHVDSGEDFDGVVRTHRGEAGTRTSAAAWLAGIKPTGSYWIRYSGPPGTIPTISWHQALRDPSKARGRLVLLGNQGELADDWARTPFDPVTGYRSMSRVEVLAQTVQSLRSPPWHPLTDLGAASVTFAMGLLGAMSALLSLSTSLLGLALAAIAWLTLAWYEQLSPAVTPALSLALGAATAWFFRFWTVERGRSRLRLLLSRYLAEPLARELLRDPAALRLAGQRRPVSVLFSDLDDFQVLAQNLPPETVIELLNAWFARLVKLVDSEQGTLKFGGHGLTVLFNAPADQPDHAQRALRLARRLDQAMLAWMQERANQGLPTFTVTHSLHSGETVVGHVGDAIRAEYLVVGDLVSVGAALDSLARRHQESLVLSQACAEQVGPEFRLRELGEFEVHGQTMRVYAPAED